MKRVKRLALWAVWGGVLVGLGLFGCHRDEFERNPNLRLLYSYREPSFGRSCYYPIWASNGRVYFTFGSEGVGFGSKLLSIREDGTDLDTVFVPPEGDDLYTFDLSPDSSTMAVLVSNKILIMTLDGVVLDTMANPKNFGPYIKFSHNGEYLFVGGGLDHYIYKVQVGDSVYEMYTWVPDTIGIAGFEVTSDDSIVVGYRWPRFCPTDSSLLVYLAYRANRWMLKNLNTGEEVELDTDPYKWTVYETTPCFSPDGKHLVFSAGEGQYSDGIIWAYLELWVLEDVR